MISKTCAACSRIIPLNSKRGRCDNCNRAYERQRKAWKERRKIASGWTWGRLREQVHRRDRVCVVCGGNDRLQVHHRVPLSGGGTNQLSNLELRCHAHHTHASVRSWEPF